MRRIIPTQTWHRTHEEIIAMIGMRNMMRARNGLASPIAARVLDALCAVGV